MKVKCITCGQVPVDGHWCECGTVKQEGNRVYVSGAKWSEAWEPVEEQDEEEETG